MDFNVGNKYKTRKDYKCYNAVAKNKFWIFMFDNDTMVNFLIPIALLVISCGDIHSM